MASSSVQGWNVGRAGTACSACGVLLAPGAGCWAALCDRPAAPAGEPHESADKPTDPQAELASSPFVRVDFCEKCWAVGKRPESTTGINMFSFWKTAIPTPEHKKKLLVDDSVLVDVFGRMGEKTDPRDIRFRFVLALILMRKRLLKYEGTQTGPDPALAVAPQDGRGTWPQGANSEIWRMIPRGQEAAVLVENPHLTEVQIAEVSQQLSAILAEEI